jgi:hypothetical protein
MVAGTSGGGFGGNSANMNVQLKPAGERKATSDQVVARLRRKTSGVPGATMFLQNSQDVRIGGRQGNAQYQYTLQAPDFESLAEWWPKLLDRWRCRLPMSARSAEFGVVLCDDDAIPRRGSASRRRRSRGSTTPRPAPGLGN